MLHISGYSPAFDRVARTCDIIADALLAHRLGKLWSAPAALAASNRLIG